MPDVDPDTHTGQLWTREHVVSALCDWITIHGQPPTGLELKRARDAQLGPSHLKYWPPGSAIRKRFGSLEAANAAAVKAHPSHFAQQAADFRAAARQARSRTMARMTSNSAATSAHSPALDLPPTAAELDPAPADPGPCPHCGQQRPDLVHSFATGSRANPSLRITAREADSPLEPDGETAHNVRLMVREIYPQAVSHPDATERVLAAIIAQGDFTYNQIDAVVRDEVSRQDALRRRQAQEV